MSSGVPNEHSHNRSTRNWVTEFIDLLATANVSGLETATPTQNLGYPFKTGHYWRPLDCSSLACLRTSNDRTSNLSGLIRVAAIMDQITEGKPFTENLGLAKEAYSMLPDEVKSSISLERLLE